VGHVTRVLVRTSSRAEVLEDRRLCLASSGEVFLQHISSTPHTGSTSSRGLFLFLLRHDLFSA
jgi:hypothetical protein